MSGTEVAVWGGILAHAPYLHGVAAHRLDDAARPGCSALHHLALAGEIDLVHHRRLARALAHPAHRPILAVDVLAIWEGYRRTRWEGREEATAAGR